MKTSKIITLILIFVIFAFIKVFFQTEIIKIGYEVKKNEDRLQELIDKNHILKYNIYALESPYSLDKYASLKNSNLRIMRPVQVLSLHSQSKPKYLEQAKRSNFLFKNSIFLALRRIFTGRQAEAKAIK